MNSKFYKGLSYNHDKYDNYIDYVNGKERPNYQEKSERAVRAQEKEIFQSSFEQQNSVENQKTERKESFKKHKSEFGRKAANLVRKKGYGVYSVDKSGDFSYDVANRNGTKDLVYIPSLKKDGTDAPKRRGELIGIDSGSIQKIETRDQDKSFTKPGQKLKTDVYSYSGDYDSAMNLYKKVGNYARAAENVFLSDNNGNHWIYNSKNTNEALGSLVSKFNEIYGLKTIFHTHPLEGSLVSRDDIKAARTIKRQNEKLGRNYDIVTAAYDVPSGKLRAYNPETPIEPNTLDGEYRSGKNLLDWNDLYEYNSKNDKVRNLKQIDYKNRK